MLFISTSSPGELCDKRYLRKGKLLVQKPPCMSHSLKFVNCLKTKRTLRSKKPKTSETFKRIWNILKSIKVIRYIHLIKIFFSFFISKLKKTLQNVGLDYLPNWRIEETIPEGWRKIHWKGEENLPDDWKHNPRLSTDFRQSGLVRCYSKGMEK